jgi:hypothetical protein
MSTTAKKAYAATELNTAAATTPKGQWGKKHSAGTASGSKADNSAPTSGKKSASG